MEKGNKKKIKKKKSKKQKLGINQKLLQHEQSVREQGRQLQQQQSSF